MFTVSKFDTAIDSVFEEYIYIYKQRFAISVQEMLVLFPQTTVFICFHVAVVSIFSPRLKIRLRRCWNVIRKDQRQSK